MLPKIPFPSLLNALLDEKGRGQGNEFVLLRSLKPGVPKMSIIQKKEKEKKCPSWFLSYPYLFPKETAQP